jgi:molybdopterin converting factor small subunit
MTVTVLFHSYFRELTGCAGTSLELESGSSLREALARLNAQFPKLASMQRSTLIAVGVEYQTADYILRQGDEISLFPPVQGG